MRTLGSTVKAQYGENKVQYKTVNINGLDIFYRLDIFHFGFGLDISTNHAIDPYSLLVSATEYPAEIDRSGWKLFGGPSFTIGGNNFASPFLNDHNYNALKAILYPRESEA